MPSYTENPEEYSADEKKAHNNQGQLIALAAVSVSCAAAAVATGSYALWLSRYKAAGEALVSVHDLLETCRERVTQMEEELAGLSNHRS